MMDGSRTRMLIGADGMTRISNSRVAVFGLGGVGGYAVEALVRAGVGALTLIDADTVSESNLNRQIFATVSTVGRLKTEAAAERILSINPSCRLQVFSVFATAENMELFGLDQCDYVIDAIDTVSSKIALAAYCSARKIPVVSCMGSGNKLHADFVSADLYETKNCPLARAMRSLARKNGIERLKVIYAPAPSIGSVIQDGARHAPGSISYVPAQAGLKCAEEVLAALLGEI